MPKIVLTGGGTAGHITPNLALLPGLRDAGYEILYVGSYQGMERDLVEKAGATYRGIATGKFRRNLSLKNIPDAFRVLKGNREALALLRAENPDIVFSKGSYVAVPVVRAAKKLHIPVIIHESDITPGLANRLCFRAAKKICCNFPDTLPYLPKDKGVCTGSPIRAELFTGTREAGLSYTHLRGDKPILLMLGGSLGARKLNEVLRAALPRLLPTFDVIHLTGKENLAPTLTQTPGYVQYEYVHEPLKDLFAAADVVFSRAGANAICELQALRKPNLLVPLPKTASRGDQILNAESFRKQGFSRVIAQEDLTPEGLTEAIFDLYENRETFVRAMEKSPGGQGVGTILSLIEEYRRK